ncbi:MAG: hypothetical protein K9K64_09140 [Desulfohalobiaceae bacterium]|nr:hypothetical protein [Desulfohalobiaceae bacterium]
MTMETEEKAAGVEKAVTGIRGLDEITRGGLPRGRTVLVSGGPGCGKTLLGLEFLYRGAAELDEPGVFICFEETALELIENVGSFGWDLRELIAEERFFIDHITVESNEILETETYDLDALFIRIMSAVQAVGARRIVLDTVESLFASLPNETLLRSELRRLFRWIKDQGLTAIITGESGERSLTRHGLEEYVSDCVIELSRRTEEEVNTRRLQILKYRGSAHETNSYPFLIDKSGFSISNRSGLRSRPGSRLWRRSWPGKAESSIWLNRSSDWAGKSGRPQKAKRPRTVTRRLQPGIKEKRDDRFQRQSEPGPGWTGFRDLGAASLRGRADRQIQRGGREPEADLRGASKGQILHRGHRPPGESAAGPGPSDRGPAHPGPEAAHADPQDHRRPGRRGAGPRGSGHQIRRQMRTEVSSMNESGKNQKAFDKAEGEQEGGGYVLQLFIAGMTPRSLKAMQELKEFCEKHLAGRYEIEIIDIYKNPEKTREENLVAVPALIKQLPQPLVKFIGDLSREEVLLKGMGLVAKKPRPDKKE